MDLETRINKKEYLYVKEGDNIKMGRQYNFNKHAFVEFADTYLFEILLNEFLREYKSNLKQEGISGNREVIYLDLDQEWEIDFMFYVKEIFRDFFITRAVKEYIK